MKTQNKTHKSPTIHTFVCVVFSLLSAIGGLAILIVVSGIVVVPVILGVFVMTYYIFTPGIRNNT